MAWLKAAVKQYALKLRLNELTDGEMRIFRGNGGKKNRYAE